MTKFLTTKNVTAKIENIIRYAEKQVIIISPFILLSDQLLTRLKDATDRGITIYLISRKLNNKEYEKLAPLKNLIMFSQEALHAKCYLNEQKVVITSMNLYESSQKTLEMGIQVTKSENSSLYQDIAQEVSSLIKNSEPHKNQKGVCIRCSSIIPLNKNKPLCLDCFKIWAQYQNSDYPENYCHHCGDRMDSTYSNPTCDQYCIS